MAAPPPGDRRSGGREELPGFFPPALETPAEGIAGVDEAGRGCLAGPVVAAAVILPGDAVLPGLADSKLVRPAARERLAEAIREVAVAWGVAATEAADIDATDILRATLCAMARAVESLTPPPVLVLVDGNVAPPLAIPTRAIVQGDRLVPAISAASILAKVTRDRLMAEWDRRFPRYGFAQHKGYGTAEHRRCIARFGPSPIHRRTFAGVREHAGAPRQGRLW
jgi:ribonuclease HII